MTLMLEKIGIRFDFNGLINITIYNVFEDPKFYQYEDIMPCKRVMSGGPSADRLVRAHILARRIENS